MIVVSCDSYTARTPESLIFKAGEAQDPHRIGPDYLTRGRQRWGQGAGASPVSASSAHVRPSRSNAFFGAARLNPQQSTRFKTLNI